MLILFLHGCLLGDFVAHALTLGVRTSRRRDGKSGHRRNGRQWTVKPLLTITKRRGMANWALQRRRAKAECQRALIPRMLAHVQNRTAIDRRSIAEKAPERLVAVLCQAAAKVPELLSRDDVVALTGFGSTGVRRPLFNRLVRNAGAPEWEHPRIRPRHAGALFRVNRAPTNIPQRSRAIPGLGMIAPSLGEIDAPRASYLCVAHVRRPLAAAAARRGAQAAGRPLDAG